MTDRMRRVDEAMREVLSAALSRELKDPRVGFVTVTSVETTPDLRHARVYVSVLGDDPDERAGLPRRPAVRARLPAAPRRRRAAPEVHAAADLHRGRDGAPRTARRAAARRRSATERSTAMTTAERVAEARQRTLEELRLGERFLLVTHEHPDGDALGSLLAMHGVLQALGKDSLMFMSEADLPRARGVPLSRVPRPHLRSARRSRRARRRVPRLREHRPHAGRRRQAQRLAHPQHRPPPRQHACSATSISSCRTHRAQRRSSGT